MIKTKLNLIKENEKILYLTNNQIKQKDMKKRLHKRFLIWKYLYCFRSWQFYRDLRSDKTASSLSRKVAKFKSHYYEKKKTFFHIKPVLKSAHSAKLERTVIFGIAVL